MRNFSIFLGRAIASMRRFRTSLLLRVVGIVVLVLLLPGWIDWLGLMGAAWALTLSWLVTVLLSLAAVLREVRRCRQHAADLPTESRGLSTRMQCGPGKALPSLPLRIGSAHSATSQYGGRRPSKNAESLDFLPRDCRSLVGGKTISEFSLPIGITR